MHKRQKSIIHKKGNLEFYRRLSHYSTLVNIFHHDGFPKRRKQQLDSFYSPRKIEPLLPLFTKKEGRKDFVIISTHHFQIAFSHPMFAGWAATSSVERKKKAKSRGKETSGQVRYNLPIRISLVLNSFQHLRQICLSYMPFPLLLEMGKKLLLFLLSSHQSTFLAGLQKNSSVDESLKINLWLELWHSYGYTQRKSFTFIHSFYLELLRFCECRPLS